MPFDSFPIPAPVVTVAEATARIAAQQAHVNDVLASFGAALGDRLTAQQATVQGIANKLVQTADARVKGQQQLVASVHATAKQAAAELVAAQQDQVNRLRGAMLAAGAPPLTGTGVPTGTPVTSLGGNEYCNTPAGQADPGCHGSFCYGWSTPDGRSGSLVVSADAMRAYDQAHGGLDVGFFQTLGVPADAQVLLLQPTNFDGTAASCQPPPPPPPPVGVCPPGHVMSRLAADPGGAPVCVPAKFWCLQCGLPPALNFAVVPDDGLADALAADPTCAVFAGPFATKDEAFANCQAAAGGAGGGGDGAGGGAPVCCPPVFETATVSADCGPLPKCPPVNLRWGDFGLAGSPEWCQHFDEIRAGIQAGANAITTWVLRTMDIADLDGGPAADVWADMKASVNPFIVAVRSLVRVLWCFGRDMLARLKCLVETSRQVAAALPGCKGLDLVSLVVLRAVINWGKDTVAGFNFGVELTIKLTINMDTVVQLIDYMIKSICPTEIPGLGEAMSTYSKGLIEFPQYRCWLGVHGYSPDVYDPVLQAQQHEQDWQAVELYGRWSGLDGNARDERLKRHSGLRDQERLEWTELYDPIPTFSQWLGWYKDDVVKPDTVAVFQLDTGFDAFWAGQGGKESRAHGLRDYAARYDWRAQYRVPGFSQAQQLLWELWPGRPLVQRPFTPEMFYAAVGMENWSPVIEEVLKDSARRFLTLQEAKTGWHRGLVANSDMGDYIRATGIRQELFPLLEVMALQDDRRQTQQEAGAFTFRTLVGAVQWGVVDPAVAAVEVVSQGYRADQFQLALDAAPVIAKVRLAQRGALMAARKVTMLALKGYQLGTVNKNAAQSALLSAGWTKDSINAVLAATDSALSMSLAQQALAVLKRAYMGGELANDQVVSLLTGAGITLPRANQYVASWRFERSNTKKMASAGQILGWVREGLLSAEIAAKRLANLGFKDPELTLMMSENAQKIAKALAAAEAKADAAAAKEAARLAALAKAAHKAHASIVSAAEKQEPLSALKKEFCSGIITERYVRDRLTYYGYESGVIDNYVAEWKSESKCQPLPA